MMHVLHNPRAEKNDLVRSMKSPAGDNVAWLHRASAALTSGQPKVLLVGGAGVADFRLRVAQSHARRDLEPSHWSHMGILLGEGDDARVWHCSLEFDSPYSAFHQYEPQEAPARDHLGLVPRNNGILCSRLELFADTVRYKNLGLIEFGAVDEHAMAEALNRARDSRLSQDLVTDMVSWLGHVWGAREADNPLLSETALPSAALVSAVYASLGVDVAPGLDGRSLCPEVVWQSAKWWADYYVDEHEGVGRPIGRFRLRQGRAAIAT